jgi:adenosylcobinamide kinase / adenosylcobinamide-phosphate guanylyltransferase
MVANVVLVTGGCRSGKSAYAQRLAESYAGPRLFIATCPATDEELRQRIAAHQAARRDRGWETVEELLDLPGALRQGGEHAAVLIDCLTLWVNNLMFAAEQEGRAVGETEVTERCQAVLAAAQGLRGAVIFVTNEVGMGIVPDNAPARRYRDLVGRANQTIAAAADTVTLLTCGIPWHLKQETQ